ncbi:MAG TPA: diaminopimelate decarboxylase [Streptosporangiaceae bacterium]|nr:diaminopimelate decarboxylase [Streptosporangiaceae bacterium]
MSGAFERLSHVLPEEASVDARGQLTIGGIPVVDLARRYGTPLHVIDEAGLRRQMRRYVGGLAARWPNSEVLFASKSLPILAMYAVAASEGMSIDVAGLGELVMAIEAGVPGARIYQHGNAKTTEEITRAIEYGVGTIIVDGRDDLVRIAAALPEGRQQAVLLRVIPNIDADTHESQATGGDTAKFGVPLDQAIELASELRHDRRIRLDGLHVHIGSQILQTAPFAEAVRRVSAVGEFPVYDIGGGLGVNYVETDAAPSIDAYLDEVVAAARAVLPAGAKLLIEPGRSIVARAGVTVYTATTVKTTGRTFVAVDGGLADHLDTALTGQRYSPIVADRANAEPDRTVQLVGRQCESGDLLVDRAELNAPAVGDTVVLAATGAYSYTLTNNYNGARKPAIVFVADGRERLAVRRESFAEFLALHDVAKEHDWSS